jgi:hypothetical protein
MRFATTVVVLVSVGGALHAQAPLDTAARLDSVAREVAHLGARHGESVWPGYRPDTIPLSFVLPTHGSLLFNWRGPLPPGFEAIRERPGVAWQEQPAPSAASTGTQIGDRAVAQIVLGPAQPFRGAALVATAFHEAFHVFAEASADASRRFGSGENSAVVGTYPLFDLENEAGMALEGRLLDSALAARGALRRELAREFIAVRRARHERLPTEYAEFDQMSEMNEGLAEYALVRALQLVSHEGPAAWRPDATEQLASRRGLLADLTGMPNLSLRFRYYQTGAAVALLLDAFAESTWKLRLTAENLTLQDALALATGFDSASEHARARAMADFGGASLRVTTARRIEQLKTSRRAKVDSVLAGPGIRLVLSADFLPNHDFNRCGFDPQNLLQVTSKISIQMRWWRPCSGGPTYAEFNEPSVHDETAGTITAVLGAESEIRVTVDGHPLSVRNGDRLLNLRAVKLEAPRASLEAAIADIARDGDVLTIRPKRP